jgi:predicted metal-dependent hydrolase
LILSSTKTVSFKELKLKHILNKKLKHSYISISKSGEIVAKTPSLKLLDELLLKKESWIRKHLKTIEQNRAKSIVLKEEILLFGEVVKVPKTLEISLAKSRSESGVLRCYDLFYKDLAKVYLVARVEFFASLMGLGYSELRFKKLTRRWGSCSNKGVITLNTNLLKLKKEYIDYVVVHELAHLVFFNHSRSFYELVKKYIPEYKALQLEISKTQM